MADVVGESRGALGLITLDRPAALNALSHGMCLEMDRVLRRWAGDDGIRTVAIRGAGGRAFCAGGDIRALYDAGRAGSGEGAAFYRDEYRLNRLIKRYPKPYVALIDGIVMGGGVGVSVHGSHRVVGDKALFAMPETGIGFFPDIGGSFFLPRLPGRLGLWLGLTGARLGAPDCLAAGIATHDLPGERHAALIDRLAAGAAVDAALGALAAPAAPAGLDRAAIDRLFAGDDVGAIMAALAADGSPLACDQLAVLDGKSPTALAVTARQLALGRTLDFEACLAMEYRLACRLARSHDFLEGVRAAVIDRSRPPSWQPSRLAEVTPARLDALFAPLPEGELGFPD